METGNEAIPIANELPGPASILSIILAIILCDHGWNFHP